MNSGTLPLHPHAQVNGNGSSQTDAAVAAVAPDCRTPMSEEAAGHLAGGAKEYAKRAESWNIVSSGA